jgi:arylsulfatase A-like enzyme/Flp pilus assembly protein TadD
MRLIPAALAVCLAACPLTSAPVRPNILLITIDTLRADHLGCYGSKTVRTPAADALAARGTLFTRAFAHNPLTLPSHTNILLGLTPNAHGVHDNSGFIVREDFLTLAEWLKAQRYETGAFVGAFPVDSRFGLVQGFDVYDDNYGTQGPTDMVFVERKAEAVVAKASEWLKGRTGPWFLWIHLFDPHHPYAPPEPFLSQYAGRPYEGEVAYTDAAVGKLLDTLDEMKISGRTAIVFTADHGESLGDHGEMTHGYFAYNVTLRVPLILAVPGAKPARVEANVCHVDIFPTICEIVGGKKPDGLQGRSLLPLARGKGLAPRPIYFEALTAYYNRGWAPLRGYILGDEKYMDSPIPEVYDLGRDFAELENLAPRTDLAQYRRTFANLVREESSPLADQAGHTLDRATSEKLRSLGYLASPQGPKKKVFTTDDDLKTLLPSHAKWMAATVAYSAGRSAEGIELLKEIISERKDFDLAYTYLANFYEEQKRPADAEAVLREALVNNPESFRIITALAIAMIDRGRFDESLDLLTRSLSLIDFDPETWNYLGVAYWNTGRLEEALQAYAHALSIDANDTLVLNNRGSLYLSRYLKDKQSSDLIQASVDFRKAVELDPRYASAWNGLGVALRQSGDIDGALEAWRKAVDSKPDFGYALYNLGLGYLEQGNKGEALSFLTKYKELFYATLGPRDRDKLDALIAQCR